VTTYSQHEKKPPEETALWGFHYGNVELGGSTKTFIYDCMGIATYKWAKKMFFCRRLYARL